MQVGVEKLGIMLKVGVLQALFKLMEYNYKRQVLVYLLMQKLILVGVD